MQCWLLALLQGPSSGSCENYRGGLGVHLERWYGPFAGTCCVSAAVHPSVDVSHRVFPYGQPCLLHELLDIPAHSWLLQRDACQLYSITFSLTGILTTCSAISRHMNGAVN